MRKKAEDHFLNKLWRNARLKPPVFMNPAIFISAFVLLGTLFAVQEWINLRQWGYHIGFSILIKSWGTQFLLWGILCWLLWRLLGTVIQRASVFYIVTRILPLSIVTGVIQEMLWVFFFPNLPLDHPHMPYWQRLVFNLDAELVDNLVIFWSAFFLFRGIGYYQLFREKEHAAAQLAVQLTNAQMSALRMQLNPHFLFNAMNSISSLMRTDIDAADTMLEQLGSLLRITLDRGNVQLIPLHEEVEFIEMYLAMQDRRFAGRVQQTLAIDAELHDALVPAMILQPIVENAYVHGLSKLDNGGTLEIGAHSDGARLTLDVLNSGIGLQFPCRKPSDLRGVGLANIQSRLRLHYGEDSNFSIQETPHGAVQVSITIPLQLELHPTQQLKEFGA
jgi:hypothetical protein